MLHTDNDTDAGVNIGGSIMLKCGEAMTDTHRHTQRDAHRHTHTKKHTQREMYKQIRSQTDK